MKLILVCALFLTTSSAIGCSEHQKAPRAPHQNEAPARQAKASEVECEAFPQKLASCARYTCHFTHPLTKEPMKRELHGLVDGKCLLVEEMPNGGKMQCRYSASMRRKVSRYMATYQKAMAEGREIRFSGSKVLNQGGASHHEETIDGKKIVNPVIEGFESGACVVLGYD